MILAHSNVIEQTLTETYRLVSLWVLSDYNAFQLYVCVVL